MDPDLAMALRVSFEEERARQEAAARAAAAEEKVGLVVFFFPICSMLIQLLVL